MDLGALVKSEIPAIRSATASDGRLTLYVSDGEKIRVREERFRYPLLHAEADFLPGAEILSGTGELNRLSFFPDEAQLSDALDRLKERGIAHSKWRDALSAALFDKKIRFFAGMKFHELVRMQLDFVRGASGVTVQLADTRGFRRTIAGRDAGKVLAETAAAILERDPDVLEGAELTSRLLPEMLALAKKEKAAFSVGRGGTAFSSRRSRFVAGGRAINCTVYDLPGRQIVDLTQLARLYDAIYRSFEDFSPETLAEYFHMPLRGIDAVRALCDMWLPNFFYRAHILPMSLQTAILRGSGSALDGFFIDEYAAARVAVPLPEAPRPFEGALTRSEETGVFSDVLHCDVRSLYPSVLLAENRAPKRDEKNLFLETLAALRKFRLAAKDRSKTAADPVEKREADALQSAFKVLINSFYGYLGFAQANFNDYELAALVTRRGREIMSSMLDFLAGKNCRVIELDTDGIYFQLPENVSGAEIENALRQMLPPAIEIEFDGDYAAMFSYKSKNYALLGRDGTVTISGAALKSRALEAFQREFIFDAVSALLTGRPERIDALYEEKKRAISERLLPLEKFAKSEVLADSPENYRKKVASGATRRSAAYELALASGNQYAAGDRVSFYVTGDRKKVSVVDNSRLLENAPAARDENIAYYLDKLDALRALFLPFVKGSAL
ncbi:MAG: hypothetical protein MJ016_01455 [Victivallaceae bacterium]|nr:hypothetical protein [Victivallaceae bacterium]